MSILLPLTNSKLDDAVEIEYKLSINLFAAENQTLNGIFSVAQAIYKVVSSFEKLWLCLEPILRVTSPALGSDDLSLDQSGMSIQILQEPNAVT